MSTLIGVSTLLLQALRIAHGWVQVIFFSIPYGKNFIVTVRMCADRASLQFSIISLSHFMHEDQSVKSVEEAVAQRDGDALFQRLSPSHPRMALSLWDARNQWWRSPARSAREPSGTPRTQNCP